MPYQKVSKFSDSIGIWNHLECSIKASPKSIAIECPHQRREHLCSLTDDDSNKIHHARLEDSPDHLAWTYEELFRASRRVAAALQSAYTNHDNTVANFMPCGVETALLIWACSMTRKTLGNLDPANLLKVRTEQLHGTLIQLKPSIVVVPDERGAEVVQEVASSLELAVPIIFIFADSALTRSTWPSLTEIALRNHFVCDTRGNEDPLRVASVIFSSGTAAGKPKGCPRQVRWLDQAIRYCGLVEEDSETPVRALVHTSTFRAVANSLVLATWARGGATVLVHAQDAKQRIDMIISHRITDLLLAPSMVYALECEQARQTRILNGVRFVTVGGEVIKPDVMDRVERLFPQAVTSVKWGMTETDCSIAWPLAWKTALKSTIPKVDGVYSIGKVTPGTSVRISTIHGSTATANGEMQEGELHINTHMTIPSYLLQADTDLSFYNDEHGRWFKTGDSAMIDKCGHIFVVGRLKDIIRRASIPINPLALETSIEAFTGSKTSVVGIPSKTLGEEPYAVVESLNGKTSDDICRHIVEKFGEDFAMRGVSTLADIRLDTLPLNDSGKVLKRQIIAQISKYIPQG